MAPHEQLFLRPVEQADLPLLAAWANDTGKNGSYNSFGFTPVHDLETRFRANGLLTDQHGTLLIVLTAGDVVGSMSYHQVRYGPNSASVAYNIGLSILPEQRGKGYGTEAQRALARYLFDTFPIARVEAETDITNIPEQRALEKAGFTREGVLRKAQWRAGAWHDLVVYSTLRGE
ncbi:MAG TPA: GNAT family protein [Roseiflexaceae bacterium]|jgi:aminoglycoside 6'-N-acetyltransferase|nr:GNAT family protein [Roseiflexaceae bacterium]